MKKFVLLSVAVASTGMAMADEMGRVISTTPVVQQVAVPRQVCSNEAVAVQQPKSGAGAVMGALAGGAAGNAVGQGGGKAVATMLGIMGGAILGDRIEGGGTSVQNVQRCTTQTFYENRATTYNVVYEYGGKQYSVQLPYDPGPTVRLQITPVGAGTVAPAAPATAPVAGGTYVTPVVETVVEPQTVYVAAPVYYPGYYAPSYAPLGVGLALGLGIGYYGHWGHGWGGHWRR
jgi:uncharacterized protein YcfJ